MKIFILIFMLISRDLQEKRVLKLNEKGRKLIADDFKLLGVIFFGFLLTIVVMGVLKHGFGVDVSGGTQKCDKNYTDIQIDY